MILNLFRIPYLKNAGGFPIKSQIFLNLRLMNCMFHDVINSRDTSTGQGSTNSGEFRAYGCTRSRLRRSHPYSSIVPGVMFQVLQYLSGQTTSGDDDQPVFTLSEPLSKGSAVFQEEFRGQKVALKVIDKRRPEQLLSKLLSLNDSSVVRYLECITVDLPVPRR